MPSSAWKKKKERKKEKKKKHFFFFFLMIRRPPRSTLSPSSAASDVYKRQGVYRDVYKNPITDSGKISKKGRLDLIKLNNGKYESINISNLKENEYHKDSLMEVVFENGEILKDYTLDEVRENENKYYRPELKRIF